MLCWPQAREIIFCFSGSHVRLSRLCFNACRRRTHPRIQTFTSSNPAETAVYCHLYLLAVAHYLLHFHWLLNVTSFVIALTASGKEHDLHMHHTSVTTYLRNCKCVGIPMKCKCSLHRARLHYQTRTISFKFQLSDRFSPFDSVMWSRDNLFYGPAAAEIYRDDADW